MTSCSDKIIVVAAIDPTKFDFGCGNCIDLWNIIRARRQSLIPIDESNLTFCNQCARERKRIK